MDSNYVPMDAGKLFSGKASGTPIMGFTKPDVRTPARDASYVFPQWIRYDVIPAFIDWSDPLWIAGPSGCGKTTGVKQVCSLLNYPVYEVTGHNRLESPELLGHMALVDGDTVWVDGPLTMAVRHGGVFLLNEIDLLEPGTLAGLNSLLDGSALTLVDNSGEAVPVHPAFKFIATANSSGNGDESGQYMGVLRQNAALQSRFMIIEAGYLPADEEQALLQKMYPALPEDVCATMVRFARLVRMDSDESDLTPFAQGINAVVGTRQLVRWGRLACRYRNLARGGVNVLEYALLRSVAADKASRTVMCELLQRVAPALENNKK